MTRKGESWAFGFDPEMWFTTGRRGRRRRRGGWFESGDMKYVILKLLAEKPMHGYEVMKALEEQTHHCYKASPGSVYPTLQMLEDEGLVKGSERDGKKVYEITDDGKKFLEENKSTVETIFDRVDEMIDHIVGDPMPEVNREMGKLVSQVYRASWRMRGDDKRRKKIGKVLEKARMKIAALMEAEGEAEADAS